jgi:hypothetical protein
LSHPGPWHIMTYSTNRTHTYTNIGSSSSDVYITGFDINGCPIARGKWNASSGNWKRHPTCSIGQVKIILWYVQFLKSKMINIELFSVGSRGEFYLNIALYASCILRHFVLFCWLRNSPFSNKDRVIYINTASTSYLLILTLHQHRIYLY